MNIKIHAPGICESCSGLADASDDLCHGCDKVICAFCSEMFGHRGDEEHGLGDPIHAVAVMRGTINGMSKGVAACTDDAKSYLTRAQAAEAKYTDLKTQAFAAQETIRAFCNYVAIAKPIEDED